MLVTEFPDQIKGKALVCKVGNQVLKAVLERKGTSNNSSLNSVGRNIFWPQQLGQFHIALEDKSTRVTPGLEASISHEAFMVIWNKWGPFQWDIMASSANVNKNPKGEKLHFFSRYFDPLSKGVNVFAQDLTNDWNNKRLD
jgi:hypothetical protein